MSKLNNIEFKIYAPTVLKSDKDGKRIIEGYASVSDVIDHQNEVITRDALLLAEKDLLENATVFYEHKHSELPIGKVIEAKVDDKGLFVKVELTQANFADDIWKLIEEGILNSFSIGGEIKAAHDKRTQDGKVFRQIDKLILYEVSIVGLPANSEAKFALAKSLKKDVKDLDLPCVDEHCTVNSCITKAFHKLEPKLTFDQILAKDTKKLTFDQILAKKDFTTDKLQPKKEKPKDESKIEDKSSIIVEGSDEIKVDIATGTSKDCFENWTDVSPDDGTTFTLTGDSTEKGKERISKPEETEDYIRIPVRSCEITATITISEEKGIKALYCGKIKKIGTYIFAKAKGWTMETAMAWVKEHDSGKKKSKTTKDEIDKLWIMVNKLVEQVEAIESFLQEKPADEKPAEPEPEAVPAGDEPREQKKVEKSPEKEKKVERKIPERKSLIVVKSPYGEESQPKEEKTEKKNTDHDWSNIVFR